MKKMFLSLLVALACGINIMAENRSLTACPPDQEIETKIDKLMQKLTLEDKIGQMTQMVLDLVLQDNGMEVSEQKMDTIFGIYRIGSLLNVPRGKAQTTENWQKYMTKIQDRSMRDLGIPCIFGLDQNHGTTYTLGGVLFPQNINLGASFNRSLAYESAKICAYETRAGSCPWVFSPVVDLTQTPLWPRGWENYGEDPYLTSEMGKSAVMGFQGEDCNHVDTKHVATCVKHYLGYGSPASGKDRTPSIIAPQDIKEKHFVPFREAVKAGALSIMVNSGSVNFMPMHANKQLLTGWLKEDLKWDGVLITDWGDVNNLYKREKVAKDKKQAIEIAINAGIDMVMEPYDLTFCTLLKELVDEGKVPLSRIDDATRRVLRLKYRLGLFDSPVQEWTEYSDFGCKKHHQVALNAAEESMVLLKNMDNILPLAHKTRIMVTGPNATSMRSLNGGWSYTWQGDGAEDLAVGYDNIVEALSHKFANNHVKYYPTVEYKSKGKYFEFVSNGFDHAVRAASNFDVIVCCIGENSYCETPGNLNDLQLMSAQQEMVRALAKTGKPIILVLNEGRPRIINGIKDCAKAIVQTFVPGNLGGDALANLMIGDVNFSGKLPYTYPSYVNSLSTYNYRQSEQVGTMNGAYNYNAKISYDWPFGFGLSYTEYEYTNLRINKQSFAASDTISVSVDVKNVGKREGKEVVMLYSTDVVASMTPEVKRLRNFEKVSLKPGETKTVTMKISGADLAFVDLENKWVLEQGDFVLTVGNLNETVKCTKTERW